MHDNAKISCHLVNTRAEKTSKAAVLHPQNDVTPQRHWVYYLQKPRNDQKNSQKFQDVPRNRSKIVNFLVKTQYFCKKYEKSVQFFDFLGFKVFLVDFGV